jgi:cation transport regulator ChaC
MKFAALLFVTLISIDALAATGGAMDQQVTIVASKIPTGEALKELGQLSAREIVVQPGLDLKKTISLNVRDKSLADVLDFIATEENVKWKPASNNTIQITR